jgi:hypothetical protein
MERPSVGSVVDPQVFRTLLDQFGLSFSRLQAIFQSLHFSVQTFR